MGLKPSCVGEVYGTAEAVPFPSGSRTCRVSRAK
jgi:hypothetical protein